MNSLSQKKCIPCTGAIPALKGASLQSLHEELGFSWKIINEHHLEKEFSFPDFLTALNFVNRVGSLAETESHHPDIYLAWGRVRIMIWTHKIDGLTESDFVLAAKIDSL